MLSQEKFETLILDPNKFLEGDIIWDKNKASSVMSDRSKERVIRIEDVTT